MAINFSQLFVPIDCHKINRQSRPTKCGTKADNGGNVYGFALVPDKDLNHLFDNEMHNMTFILIK